MASIDTQLPSRHLFLFILSYFLYYLFCRPYSSNRDKSTTINNAVKQRICQATKSTPHEINEVCLYMIIIILTVYFLLIVSSVFLPINTHNIYISPTPSLYSFLLYPFYVQLLRTFEQMQDIHRLFVNRAKNGQSLPASQEDLQTMMAEDPQIRAKFRKQMTRRR